MTETNNPHSAFQTQGQREVRLERRLEASTEEIWTLLVTPEEAAIWLTALDIEPRLGGSYTLFFNNGMPTSRGHITVFEPPKLLEFSWYEGESIESRVRIELRADAGTTVLRLTHNLLQDTDNLKPYAEGWMHHLERLVAQVAERG